MAHSSSSPPVRMAALKRRIARLGLLCSGTLLERTKVCGKPACRCAADPAARHGPYYEWNRRLQGRLHHRIVSPAQAQVITQAMNEYQTLLGLLADWEDASAQVILGAERLSPQTRRR